MKNKSGSAGSVKESLFRMNAGRGGEAKLLGDAVGFFYDMFMRVDAVMQSSAGLR